jgi:hypothetical protein
MIDTVQLVTITNPSRIVGIRSSEVVRALVDLSEEDKGKEAIRVLESSGRFYKLEEMLLDRSQSDFRSILIVGDETGEEYGVAVSGMIDIVNMNARDILPVPAFVMNRQKPTFVWGFARMSTGMIMLVTFEYIRTKGAA